MNIAVHRINSLDSEACKTILNRTNKISINNSVFFDDDKNILLVASIGNELAGVVRAYLLFYPDKIKPAMFLYSIDVFPEFQRKGIGTMLINELKKISNNAGCSEIFVITGESNLRAQAFYNATGGIREEEKSQLFIYKLT